MLRELNNRNGLPCHAAHRWLALCVCLSIAACSSYSGSNPGSTVPPTLPNEEPLVPGDAIQLAFSLEPGLNGVYPIDASGMASLPLIGTTMVTDRSAVQVKADLEEKYSRVTRNQTIQVVWQRRVRVMGEVRNPGMYRLDPTMTFDDAIALAGGGMTDANLEKVSLVRDGDLVATGIDARWTVGASLKSGDQIFVPKTSWFYRNAGMLIGATISALGLILAFGN